MRLDFGPRKNKQRVSSLARKPYSVSAFVCFLAAAVFLVGSRMKVLEMGPGSLGAEIGGKKEVGLAPLFQFDRQERGLGPRS